jgi:hypothetical protein
MRLVFAPPAAQLLSGFDTAEVIVENSNSCLINT